MASKSKVYFFFDKVNIPLRNRTGVKKRVEGLFKKEKENLDRLNYIFCTDEALLKINRQYLNHDYYTDIITFDLSEKDGAIIGEVYISIDRVRENATKHKVPIAHELRRVIFHGALHLCGYKDRQKVDKENMKKREDYYLAVP